MKQMQTLPLWCVSSRREMRWVMIFKGETKCSGDSQEKGEGAPRGQAPHKAQGQAPPPPGNLGRLPGGGVPVCTEGLGCKRDSEGEWSGGKEQAWQKRGGRQAGRFTEHRGTTPCPV